MNDPVVITLEAVGTKKYPRWLIITKDGRFWNGHEWTDKKPKALLYADAGTASKDVEEILRLAYFEKRCVRLILVPLIIEVRSDEPIDPEKLKAWVKKAATLYVDYRQHGNGPDGGSMVLMAINWEEIK